MFVLPYDSDEEHKVPHRRRPHSTRLDAENQTSYGMELIFKMLHLKKKVIIVSQSIWKILGITIQSMVQWFTHYFLLRRLGCMSKIILAMPADLLLIPLILFPFYYMGWKARYGVWEPKISVNICIFSNIRLKLHNTILTIVLWERFYFSSAGGSLLRPIKNSHQA